MTQEQLWLLLIANFPLVSALFIAMYKGWLVMGPSFDKQMKAKDDEIAFRESLRKEALADKDVIMETAKERTIAIQELSALVKESTEFNSRLLEEVIGGSVVNEQRVPRRTSRTSGPAKRS